MSLKGENVFSHSTHSGKDANMTTLAIFILFGLISADVGESFIERKCFVSLLAINEYNSCIHQNFAD
jgi:hypothetical protein